MNTKHTPGPWNAQEFGACVWDANGHRVATVHGRGKPDAALIAEAPAMLAALRHAVDTEEGNWRHDDEPQWLADARAILARIDNA